MGGALHPPVTIGTANGLSISQQVLSMGLSSSSTTGALSSADWTTFNNKLSSSRQVNTTAPLTGGGALTSDLTLAITQSSGSTNGYLSSTDWTTFNNKVSATRAINTTAPLAGGGNLSADRTLTITQSTTSTDGYLSSTDWNTFNSKQGALTGSISGTANQVIVSANSNSVAVNITLSLPQNIGTGSSPTFAGLTIGSLTGILKATSGVVSTASSADLISAIGNAAADGVTKGVATFTASDFNSSSGLISIDYTNGQAASATLKGFLTSADWTTFNNKVSGSGTTDTIARWAGSNTLDGSLWSINGSGVLFSTNFYLFEDGGLGTIGWNGDPFLAIDPGNNQLLSYKTMELPLGTSSGPVSLYGPLETMTGVNFYDDGSGRAAFQLVGRSTVYLKVGGGAGPAFSLENNEIFWNQQSGFYTRMIADHGSADATVTIQNFDGTLAFLSDITSALSGYVPTSRTINTTSPLAGGGDLSADRTLSIANAAADGTTKGAATFTASDFNSSSGLISIDYTNGQAASSSLKGFLTSADWTTFNNKATFSFVTIATPAGTSPVADAAADTLTLTSSDSSVVITGTAATDTIDFSVLTVLGGYIKKDGTTTTTGSIPFAQGASIAAGKFLQLTDLSGNPGPTVQLGCNNIHTNLGFLQDDFSNYYFHFDTSLIKTFFDSPLECDAAFLATSTAKVNTNSTSAFIVERSGVNDNVFRVDTTNNASAFGTAPNSGIQLFVSDATKTTVMQVNQTHTTRVAAATAFKSVGTYSWTGGATTLNQFSGSIVDSRVVNSGVADSLLCLNFSVSKSGTGSSTATTSNTINVNNSTGSDSFTYTRGDTTGQNVTCQVNVANVNFGPTIAHSAGAGHIVTATIAIQDGFLNSYAPIINSGDTLNTTCYIVRARGTASAASGAGTHNSLGFAYYSSFGGGFGSNWCFYNDASTAIPSWVGVDNAKLYFGTGTTTGTPAVRSPSASIYYDATNLVVKANEVGSGRLSVPTAETINTNSTSALLVEQTGVNSNCLIVDTTNSAIGIGAAPASTIQINAQESQKSTVMDLSRTLATRVTGVSSVRTVESLTWTGSVTTHSQFSASIVDSRTINAAGTNSTNLFNSNMSAIPVSSIASANNYRCFIKTMVDSGTYERTAGNTSCTITSDLLTTNAAPVYDDHGNGRTLTYTSQANSLGLSSGLTINSGTVNMSVIGTTVGFSNGSFSIGGNTLNLIYIGFQANGTWNTAGTSSGFGFINEATGADKDWGFYNNTASDSYLGRDNSKTWWGTNTNSGTLSPTNQLTTGDASAYYDGTDFNINPKEVGTGILKVLSGGSYAGDLKLTTAGNGLYVKEGTNATMGIATMVGGTVVVNTTKVTANSRIFLTSNVDGGTPAAAIRVSARTAGTSFTITSTNVLDTSQIAWLIMEPA